MTSKIGIRHGNNKCVLPNVTRIDLKNKGDGSSRCSLVVAVGSIVVVVATGSSGIVVEPSNSSMSRTRQKKYRKKNPN